ncbi:MAG: hypothetical protein Q8N94_03550 [Methanoregula sp.]|nr:hypothetical protein [Methanoregula sp.]
MNYDNLTIKSHGNRLYPIKRWIGSFPPLRRMSNSIASGLASITRHIQSIEQIQIEESTWSSKNPNQSKNDPTVLGSEYGYPNEIAEFGATMAYYYTVQEILNNDPMANLRETKVLFEHIDRTICDLLTNDTNIKHFIDFGVCYAYMDTGFAKKFPHLECIGIDRSRLTKMLNDMSFPDILNYQTSNENIYDFLNKRKFTGGIFFTSRTLTYLPKSFIEELFAAVSKAGFKYIVGFETVGISLQTLEPYPFSDTSQPSVIYRSSLFIHNYPAILKQAGYNIADTVLIKTGHQEEDCQIIKYVGVKSEYP